MKRTIHAARTAVAGATLAVCAGCVSYKPEPLSPVAIQQQLRRYSLADLAAECVRTRPAERPLDISSGLGPDEIGLAALVFNPALKAKRLSEGIACGQLLAAGLYPNPSLDNKSLLTSQKPPGRKCLEASLSFEILSRREIAAEKQAKAAAVEATRYEILGDEWKAVTEARTAYWNVVGSREKLRLNKERLELSGGLLEIG